MTISTLHQPPDLKNIGFCKSVRLRSQESFGSQSSLRTTDSNQVFGVRGPRLWNIRFCSVCSHQERSTWATWLTHWGLPPGVKSMWGSLFRHANSNDLPNIRQVDIGGLWTPSILQSVAWNFVTPTLSLKRTLCTHCLTKLVECRLK